MPFVALSGTMFQRFPEFVSVLATGLLPVGCGRVSVDLATDDIAFESSDNVQLDEEESLQLDIE